MYLRRAIEATLVVARNEAEGVAEVARNFDASLPPLPCFPGELNRVLLNRVLNAAQAIAALPNRGAGGKGKIHISTRRKEDSVEMRISDTGIGIPKEAHRHIFEPFFTTKELGKGTGQGLYLAYSSIVNKHKGALTFESQPGVGTTFIIALQSAAAATDRQADALDS